MSIKKYINQNRLGIDRTEVPSDLWESISGQIKAPPKRRIPYGRVAALLVIALAIPLMWNLQIKDQQVQPQNQLLPSSFLSLEKNYSQELDSLEKRIPLVEVEKDQNLNWMLEELAALENINIKYRNDIGDGVPQEELIKVLIDYYEKRLHLLTRIERELKRKEKHHPHENIIL
jgi:hypothetical protein